MPISHRPPPTPYLQLLPAVMSGLKVPGSCLPVTGMIRHHALHGLQPHVAVGSITYAAGTDGWINASSMPVGVYKLQLLPAPSLSPSPTPTLPTPRPRPRLADCWEVLLWHQPTHAPTEPTNHQPNQPNQPTDRSTATWSEQQTTPAVHQAHVAASGDRPPCSTLRRSRFGPWARASIALARARRSALTPSRLMSCSR